MQFSSFTLWCLMGERNISCSQLASDLGVSPVTVSRWRYYSQISVLHFYRLCKYLKVSYQYLREGFDDEHPKKIIDVDPLLKEAEREKFLREHPEFRKAFNDMIDCAMRAQKGAMHNE